MQRPDCKTNMKRSSVIFLVGTETCDADLRSDGDRRSSAACNGWSDPPDPMRRVIEASVGQVFGILSDDFGSVTRGRARVALARQIAMYLCHVTCRRSLTDVGRVFDRDRTTVAHACGVVEDLRDDQRFDRVLDLLEAIVRYRLTPHASPSGERVPGCAR